MSKLALFQTASSKLDTFLRQGCIRGDSILLGLRLSFEEKTIWLDKIFEPLTTHTKSEEDTPDGKKIILIKSKIFPQLICSTSTDGDKRIIRKITYSKNSSGFFVLREVSEEVHLVSGGGSVIVSDEEAALSSYTSVMEDLFPKFPLKALFKKPLRAVKTREQAPVESSSLFDPATIVVDTHSVEIQSAATETPDTFVFVEGIAEKVGDLSTVIGVDRVPERYAKTSQKEKLGEFLTRYWNERQKRSKKKKEHLSGFLSGGQKMEK